MWISLKLIVFYCVINYKKDSLLTQYLFNCNYKYTASSIHFKYLFHKICVVELFDYQINHKEHIPVYQLYATTKLNKTVRTKNQTTDMIFAFFWHKNEEFKNYASKFLVNSANCIGYIAYFKYAFVKWSCENF